MLAIISLSLDIQFAGIPFSYAVERTRVRAYTYIDVYIAREISTKKNAFLFSFFFFVFFSFYILFLCVYIRSRIIRVHKRAYTRVFCQNVITAAYFAGILSHTLFKVYQFVHACVTKDCHKTRTDSVEPKVAALLKCAGFMVFNNGARHAGRARGNIPST